MQWKFQGQSPEPPVQQENGQQGNQSMRALVYKQTQHRDMHIITLSQTWAIERVSWNLNADIYLKLHYASMKFANSLHK